MCHSLWSTLGTFGICAFLTEDHQCFWTSKCQEQEPRNVEKVYERDKRGAEREEVEKESTEG